MNEIPADALLIGPQHQSRFPLRAEAWQDLSRDAHRTRSGRSRLYYSIICCKDQVLKHPSSHSLSRQLQPCALCLYCNRHCSCTTTYIAHLTRLTQPTVSIDIQRPVEGFFRLPDGRLAKRLILADTTNPSNSTSKTTTSSLFTTALSWFEWKAIAVPS